MKTFLLWLLSLFATDKPVIPDTVKEADAAPPRPDVKVVSPVLEAEKEAGVKTGVKERWYLQPEMLEVLRLIMLHEAGKAGYNADYRNDDRWKLDNYTFDEVRSLSRRQVSVDKEASSAIGGYQFLTKTLDSLKSSLKLSGSERFTPAFQDDLAIALMIRRGLMDFLRGNMNIDTFGNRMAMEWASLPVFVPTYRGKRLVKAGQSYYAGDGLNSAFHKVDTVRDAFLKMKRALVAHMPKE